MAIGVYKRSDRKEGRKHEGESAIMYSRKITVFSSGKQKIMVMMSEERTDISEGQTDRPKAV